MSKPDFDESYYDNYYLYQFDSDLKLFHEWNRLNSQNADIAPELQAVYNGATERLNNYDAYLQSYGQNIWEYDQEQKPTEVFAPDVILPAPLWGEDQSTETYNWDSQPSYNATVVFSGYKEVEAKAVYDFGMGYIHGLAGAEGAYGNRSDKYKGGYNLGNNAMRKLADAAGLVAETAPPVLPGRGLGFGMELAASGAVARTSSVAAPMASIYFSSAENGQSVKSNHEASESMKDVRQVAAEEVNSKYPANYETPYKPDTSVTEFTTTVETDFVRVHGANNRERSWMMKKVEIEGLTPEQIKDKFALPEAPTLITDVKVPPGIRMRFGEASGNIFGNGGGTQYELLERLEDPAAWQNTRKLGE